MPTPLQSTTTTWHGMEIVSRGANRMCVRHSGDPAYCLKFELPARERTRVGLRQNLRRWLARHWPMLGENRTELRAYLKLRARLGGATDPYLATCHGIVTTPQGDALQCACILSATGEPAPSLYHCLFTRPIHAADELCVAVDEFEDWLIRHDVPLFDLNAGNFVVQEWEGRVRLVCVDTKSVLSGKEILPFSRWSKGLMHRKIARRAQRLRDRVRAALPDAASLQ